MIATMQLINTTPGPNERAVITVQYATFDPSTNRRLVEIVLKHTAQMIASSMEMKNVSRLPVTWQENPE